MKKAAVIYWSGTGNTEAMANAVLEGMKSAGADAVLLTASDVDVSAVGGYDAVALGCPAMGSEVLEDMEFEPMFDGCKASLKGKRVALFGSYGWGGGEWMHNWERDCRSSGIQLACDSVICNEAPDDAALAACQALGKPTYALVSSVCRQIVVLLPAAYLLSLTGRLELVWLSFPIAEIVSVIMNAAFLKRTYRASLGE